MIAITGARVVTIDGLAVTDILIEGDRVASLGSPARTRGAEILDGHGLVVGPGLVDLHVHLRDPGQTWKEDLVSGSRAAAAGGFTAIVGMPNTDPAIDDVDLVREVEARAAEVGLVELRMAASVTTGRQGERLVDFESLHKAGVRMFTDDGDPVADESLLRKAMTEIAQLPGTVLADHTEDRSLTASGHMHDGERSRALGISGWSASAESTMVLRDLSVARETGAHLHLQHLSTAEAVAALALAKRSGTQVTAEVTPHHLSLTEEDIHLPDPNFKMYPPLRSAEDRASLIAGLASGAIDAVATDHAPHDAEEKSAGFEAAPRGVIGLETAMATTLEAMGGDLEMMFDRMSVRPARIAGLDRHGNLIRPGVAANLVLIDPVATWTVTKFHSKSANSPFLGRTLTGRVLATIHEGELVEWGGGHD